MDSQTPHSLGRIAEIGDVLVIGQFTKPGSPARSKEPYLAFRRPTDESVSSIYHGDTFEIYAPEHEAYDGRVAVANTHAFDRAVMRSLIPLELVFGDTGEAVPLADLPTSDDFQLKLIERPVKK